MARITQKEIHGVMTDVIEMESPTEEIDFAAINFREHAHRHAADGEDPLTLGMIGAAASSDLEKYLPRDGSARMTAALVIAREQNGYSMVDKNHDATADYGTDIRDYDSTGALVMLKIQAVSDKVYFANRSGATNEVLHAGNKPSGTYTGNGSSTSRTISTNGIGSAIAIWSDNGLAIVTPAGAVKNTATGTSISGLSESTCAFKDGVLTLASTDTCLNENRVTYNYQVL